MGRRPKTQPPPAPAWPGRREWLAWAGGGLLIYSFLATWGQLDFRDFFGYYNLLADGMLSGHLYIQPKPGETHLIDMIPYQGRYYLQWGPLPGVLHMAAKLAGGVLTDRAACLLAGWLSGLAFLEMVARLRRLYFANLPAWIARGFVAAFALGSPAVLVALRATVYHESIVIANLFVLLALLALLRYLEAPSAGWAAWAGAAIGLAMTTRISLAVYGAGLAAAFVRLRRPAHLAAFGVPAALDGLAMLAYNQARFGSPWEYGLRYLRGPEHRAYAWNRIPENFRHYVLAPIRFQRDIPWVTHTGWPPLVRTERAEDMSSLVLGSPFLLLAAAAGRHFRRRDAAPESLRVFLAVTGGSAMLVFLSLLCLDGASRRYAHDFVPAWLIVAFAGAGGLAPAERLARWRPAALAALAFSVVLHLHLVFFLFLTTDADPNALQAFAALGPVLQRLDPGRKLAEQIAVTHNDLGVWQLREGHPADAVRHFEQAAAVMPGSERIQRNLRLARSLAGL